VDVLKPLVGCLLETVADDAFERRHGVIAG
jgi:hypothetical protein